MRQIRLKSRVGPLHLRRRIMSEHGYEVQSFDWEFDNNFINELPEDYWAEVEDQILDRQTGLRYRNALIAM